MASRSHEQCLLLQPRDGNRGLLHEENDAASRGHHDAVHDDKVAHRPRLGHQPLVDRGAAGGVQHDHVIALQAAGGHRPLGDGQGGLALDNGKGVDADLLAERAELLARRRAGDVERRHEHLLAVALGEALGQLGGVSVECLHRYGFYRAYSVPAWRHG